MERPLTIKEIHHAKHDDIHGWTCLGNAVCASQDEFAAHLHVEKLQNTQGKSMPCIGRKDCRLYTQKSRGATCLARRAENTGPASYPAIYTLL